MAARASIRESTRARDESYLHSLILPRFGATRIADVDEDLVAAWVAELTASGKAPATVRKAHQLLGQMLEAAVKTRRIPRNPAKWVELPRLEKAEMRFLTPDQVDVLAETIDSRYRTLILVAAYTGLRWDEAAGLKIDRLDMLRGALTVAETLSEVRGRLDLAEPKTAASRRRIALPRFVVDDLGRHLSQYLDPDGWVFTAPNGGPLRRTNFRRRVWIPAVRESGLEALRFHDLHHTHVAFLIAQGEHPKTIQTRLGHSSITTTLDTHGHLFEGLDDQAATRLDETRQAATSDPSNTPTVRKLRS